MPDTRYRSPTYHKDYRASNPERVKAWRRRYYIENRERVLAEQKARYYANVEVRRERQRQYNATHRDVINDRLRERKYGVSPEEYAAMYRMQGGACAVCLRVTARRLHIDHDHSTGRVRGLLCDDCNLGLGKFADNVTRLRRALVYLEGSQ